MESPLEFRKLTDKFRGLDKLNLAVALVDTSFNVLHFNNGFLRLFPSSENSSDARKLETLFSNFSHKLDNLKHAGLLSGHLLNFVIPGVQQTGKTRFFDLQVGRLDLENDGLEGFSVTFIDVTDREKELNDLRESSDHHKKFIQFTPSGVMIHRDGKVVFVNDQGCKMVNASRPEDVLGRSVLDFVTEDFSDIVIDRIRKMSTSQEPFEVIEEKVIREDGSTFDAEIYAYPISFEGKPAIKVIINDVSPRMEAEKRLRNSEKKYQELVNNVHDVIFQTDTNANITYLDSAWKNLTGYSVDESLGQPIIDYLIDPQGDEEALYVQVRRLLMLGISTHERDLLIRTANEGEKYIQVKFSAIYDEDQTITGISGMVINIDARKRAELTLQGIEQNLKNQQKLFVNLAKSEVLNGDDFNETARYIAKTSAEALSIERVNIWQFDQAAGTLSCITNYDKEKDVFSGEGQVLGEFNDYMDLIKEEKVVNADDALNDERVADFLDSYIKPSGIRSMMDVAIYTGEQLWGVICFDTITYRHHWTVEDRAFAVNLADMLGMAWLNSEKRQTVQALQKSEELYATLVNNAGDAILIINPDGEIEDVNKLATEMSGYSRDEMVGNQVMNFIPERYRGEGKSGIEGFDTFVPVKKLRYILDKEGNEKLMEVSSSKMEDGRVMSILRDVTEREANAHALRESEARLDMALKGADLGTWDNYIKDDRIIHNRRWAEMLGYNFEITTVNEQFWEKFVHPADIDPANEKFLAHIRGETPYYEATIRMLASSGEWRWILDKGRIVEWDDNGEPVRASGIHQDVTALKTIEKEIKNQRIFLQQIINAIPYPLYVKNLNDEFVLINNSFAEFLGVDRQQVLQYKFNKKASFDSTKKALFEPDYEIYLNRQAGEIEEHQLLNSSTGKTHWLHTIKVPLKDVDGNMHEILSISTDISSIKEREMREISRNETMENKLAVRTSMLEQANSEIETFNYSVSHDLRTPLRTIDIFAYFLEKNYAGQLDEEGKDNIKQIRSSITKMTTLIDNLLIYVKVGKTDLQKEDVDLKAVIEEVLKEIGKTFDIRAIDFRFGKLPRMYADRSMIKQALFNLLSNSVKFTSTRTNPKITIEGDLEAESSLIRISDNGVGFSMEYKDKLFKALKRLHSEEHFEGTGVGLAIVERIVSRHLGQIWAESEPDVHTTFFLRLPL